MKRSKEEFLIILTSCTVIYLFSGTQAFFPGFLSLPLKLSADKMHLMLLIQKWVANRTPYKFFGIIFNNWNYF